ncbi:type II secretion system protein [Neobacillus drentensis]|uniref:type II secretion system protein n=1 Tax=Neobacillus drentensis TaxID=220684 RepID=UPI002FFE67D3
MYQLLKNKLKDQRGLTLIELLAVIVILGIIAAIAVPAIGNLITNTENKATVAEGIQIINAAKMYTAENNPPTGTTLKDAQLGASLDNVKTTTYVVTVTLISSGKYTYSLTAHPSVALVDKDASGDGKGAASESELLTYKP